MTESQSRHAAGKSGRRPATHSSKAKAPIRINVAPDKLAGETQLFARIKDKAVTSSRGVLVSLVLHTLLLCFLGIFVVGGQRSKPAPPLELGWIGPPRQKPPDPVRGPIQLGPITLDTQSKNTTRRQPKTTTSTTGVAPPVQPASTERALAGRGERVRNRILRASGGDDQTERALSLGLTWLARQQHVGGNWHLHQGYPDAGYSVLRTDTGATALSLLAFLGIGHTHQQGQHQETVATGLNWLKRIQKTNGDLHDWDELGRQTAYYAHSQATIVLCEAYALTGDESLRQSAESAVQFLIESQHPSRGGWRYQPQSVLAESDLSVTGWALMALHSGRMAGIEVSEEAFFRASIFVDSVQEQHGARYKYMPNDPASRSSLAMTSEGLLCRQWLGWPKDHQPLVDGVRYVLSARNTPAWSAGRRNVYEWYYTAQLLHNIGGDSWKNWYRMVQSEIVKHQVKRGSRKEGRDIHGSWNPTRPVGADAEYAAKAGRLYLTALCLLVLETPFRHAPLYAKHSEESPRKVIE